MYKKWIEFKQIFYLSMFSLYCNQIMIHGLILSGEDGEPVPLLVEGEVKKQRKRQARKKSQLENSFPNYLQVLLHFGCNYVWHKNTFARVSYIIIFDIYMYIILVCQYFLCY